MEFCGKETYFIRGKPKNRTVLRMEGNLSRGKTLAQRVLGREKLIDESAV